MMRQLLSFACLAATAYLFIVVVLFFAQRAVIFPAPKTKIAVPRGFEEVSFRTADALTLAAAYRPARAGMPTAVFFHGNGDNWEGAAFATSALAEAGYGLLLAEYRGYSGNPGSPSETGLYEDGRAALGWLEAKGIDRTELVIIGNSVGTGVAVQMAVEFPPAALILVSPLASLPELAADQFPWPPARWLVRDRFENSAKIEHVAAPILILHGKADRVIPFAHALSLARNASRAHLELFDGVGHELAYLDRAGEVELRWLGSVLEIGRGDEAKAQR